MDFGEKLRHLREKKGLGVNQLALKSAVNASNISRLEKGERKDPTFETVKKLSKALGVSISYFDDEQEPDTVAAHVNPDLTEEEQENVDNYIDFIISQRKEGKIK
ncbi:helix-turn-helix domain-containing protein [Candidatus Enterococcus clewellii]|uniref:HTH cro/C1-type domain-containing protein n=1 Tax=Candidatus Enterococcus clewellii TaxID=1834193 RepID=A0A242K8Q9_9ENTE|nr:helix-turn-helix transcriptional regulator [Enterococcus sp. 9E7_DIV0242]OTP17459.1 hypothetical protein A5888_001597 [Enterococcus sp. 9E7_DIV0242]